MGLKNLNELKQGASNSEAIEAKSIPIGESIEGYLVGFIETESQFEDKDGNTTQYSPKLKLEDGSEKIIWAAGNLKFLKKDFEDIGCKLGTFIRITRKEPKKGSRMKFYFDREVDDTRVLTMSDEGSNGKQWK